MTFFAPRAGVSCYWSHVCSHRKIGTLSNTTPSTGPGDQFFQLISLPPDNTYQLKELAAALCPRRRLA